MGEALQHGEARDAAASIHVLPEDVRNCLGRTLHPDEGVTACLFADLTSAGDFGEHWTFLTDRRLLVLSPNGGQGPFPPVTQPGGLGVSRAPSGPKSQLARAGATGQPGESEIHFEKPLDEIEDATVRDYVSSGALIVQGRSEAQEVARFSLASRTEASDLCHHLKEIVRQRREGGGTYVPPPPPKRPPHRCTKCGRALRRQGAVCVHCIERRRLIARLLSYLLPYRGYAVLGLTLTVAMTGLQLFPPYLTKVLVDDVIQVRDVSLLPLIVLLLTVAYVGRALIAMVRTYLMQWIGERVLYDLRVEVFDHLQLLHLSYYNQRQTGQIMARVTGDLRRLQYFIAEGFQEILINLMTVLLIAVILLGLNWRLFLLALAPIPIITVSTVIFGRRIHLLYHRIWRRMASLSAILADTIPGIRVVKAFAQERRESKRFSQRSADLFVHQLRAAKLSSAFFPFLGLMTGLGIILIFSVGSRMVLAGTTTLGVLMAFTGYLWQFYAPVQQFGQMNHRLQHCSTSAERVFEVLDTDVEPVEHTDGVVLCPVQGRVEFRNVRFSYEPGKYALNGLSFAVEPGEMIGLVGPSGAGKSTLVHLIARFYDIDEGEILIDGHDVQDLDLRSYRRQIGVVLQEPYLFHGTIWDNIAYANPEATADEIIEAARAANAHEFVIGLPDGYDTVVGERGQTLSGGERQRLSIARAILRDPRILILDEATASVDTETELMIQTALERLIENRTTFAIAHRISTLRKANRLVVLERGRLVEKGTHEELVASGGLYSRLCQYQAEMSKMRAW